MHRFSTATPNCGSQTDDRNHQYLLASKKLPQARHLHCMVITWLPNNEMISVS
jgi:hypothetical protein